MALHARNTLELHWLEKVKVKNALFRKECIKAIVAGLLMLMAAISVNTSTAATCILATVGIVCLIWAVRGMLQALKFDTRFPG